jgi:hypothetical protein
MDTSVRAVARNHRDGTLRLTIMSVRIPVVAMVVVLAACAPVTSTGDPAPPVVETIPVETSAATAGADTTTSTTADTTTTTLVDPTGDFLESLVDAPAVTASVGTGFRTWVRQDGVWVAGTLATYADGPFDEPPLAVMTPSGLVHGAGGTVVLGDQMAASGVGELADVAVAGSGPVVITFDGGRVQAVDLATGSATLLYQGSGEVTGASYGSGRLVVVRGAGGESLVTEVGSDGSTSTLDLLTDGAPRSVVLTPDGSTLVFSTDADDSDVYTLPVGSQGPAAAIPLPVEGPITRLDTDGEWVAGMVGDQSFLLDLNSGTAFVGPVGVRFTFDRSTRAYTGPGVDQIIDGRFFGWVRSAGAQSIEFDEAEFLTGEDAAAAAEAAGEESPPPNDFFIRNTTEDTTPIPLADDPDIRIQGNVLQAGIGLEPVTLAQWLLLLEGDTNAVDFEWYGAGALPYWITVEGGEVVAVEEVYLP